MNIQIRNNIPVPGKKKIEKTENFQGEIIESLNKMKKGESFELSSNNSGYSLSQFHNKIVNSVYNFRKQNPRTRKSFTTRSDKNKNTVGVWRIK